MAIETGAKVETIDKTLPAHPKPQDPARLRSISAAKIHGINR